MSKELLKQSLIEANYPSVRKYASDNKTLLTQLVKGADSKVATPFQQWFGKTYTGAVNKIQPALKNLQRTLIPASDPEYLEEQAKLYEKNRDEAARAQQGTVTDKYSDTKLNK